MDTEVVEAPAAPVESTPAAPASAVADLKVDVPSAIEDIGESLMKELGVEPEVETPEQVAARETEEKAAADKKAASEAAAAAAKVVAPAPGAKPAGSELDPATGKPKIPSTLPNGLPQEFRTWRPEAQTALLELQKLSATNPTLKPLFDEAVKREQDMDRGISQYKEAATYADQFRKVVAPFMPLMQHHQIDPLKEIGELLQMRATLALGTPEQKSGLVRSLIKAAGLDPTSLAIPEEPVSPEVAALHKRLAEVESQSSQQIEALRAERAGQLRGELETFAADPANRYFDRVAGRIPQLITSGLAKGYKDAYEMAVRLDPVVAAEEAQRIAKEAADTAKAKQAEEEAARAKAKAANVRSSAKNRSAAAPVGSIEDTLKETAREIFTRA